MVGVKAKAMPMSGLYMHISASFKLFSFVAWDCAWDEEEVVLAHKFATFPWRQFCLPLQMALM